MHNKSLNLGRIPVRPLDLSRESLREAKELLVNYESGELWMSDKDKNLRNITASAESVIDQVFNKLVKEKDILSNISFKYINEAGEEIETNIRDALIDCYTTHGALSNQFIELSNYIYNELNNIIAGHGEALDNISSTLASHKSDINNNKKSIENAISDIKELNQYIKKVEKDLTDPSNGQIAILKEELKSDISRLENRIYITTKEFNASDPDIPKDALIYVQIES